MADFRTARSSLFHFMHFWFFFCQISKANWPTYIVQCGPPPPPKKKREQFAPFSVSDLSRFQSLLQRPIGSCLSTEFFAPVSTPIDYRHFTANQVLQLADLPKRLAQLQVEQFWLMGNTGTTPRLKTQLGEAYPLVLAGGKGWLMDDFQHTVNRLGLEQDVILLGYVDDQVLQWLYQNCISFAF